MKTVLFKNISDGILDKNEYLHLKYVYDEKQQSAEGTNFQRPAFEQMMDDVRDRRADCIVVKDLSRFARNYIETGYYLETIFLILNVRFVAITDNYDTLKNTSSDDMVASLNISLIA